jgi:transcriptional regulator with XRE-family HTH domain
MGARGLKASKQGIEKAGVALAQYSLSQNALAKDLGLSRSTVNNFFKGQPIDRDNFALICDRLGLDLENTVAINDSASEPDDLVPEEYLIEIGFSYQLTPSELALFVQIVLTNKSIGELAVNFAVSPMLLKQRLRRIYQKFFINGDRANKRVTLKKFVIAKYQSEKSNNSHKQKQEDRNTSKVIRSIEFPPEYWESGTSILSYFSRILRVKYPSNQIKVRIDQEDLMLRMTIDTPDGKREEIEKTLKEYGMVVTGKMQPETLLDDPFEVMALKNKLEIANLELRQTRNLLAVTTSNNQQRIESLEVQVGKLHCIIEMGLQSRDRAFEVMEKMTEQDKSIYNLSNPKFGGGFAAGGGFQVGGNFTDMSSANNLTDAAQQIQELLQQLQNQGISAEEARQKAASDLAEQAKADPTTMGKLVRWGQSLADTAGKTTISEAAKAVVKLALQMSGVPLP